MELHLTILILMIIQYDFENVIIRIRKDTNHIIEYLYAINHIWLFSKLNLSINVNFLGLAITNLFDIQYVPESVFFYSEYKTVFYEYMSFTERAISKSNSYADTCHCLLRWLFEPSHYPSRNNNLLSCVCLYKDLTAHALFRSYVILILIHMSSGSRIHNQKKSIDPDSGQAVFDTADQLKKMENDLQDTW